MDENLPTVLAALRQAPNVVPESFTVDYAQRLLNPDPIAVDDALVRKTVFLDKFSDRAIAYLCKRTGTTQTSLIANLILHGILDIIKTGKLYEDSNFLELLKSYESVESYFFSEVEK